MTGLSLRQAAAAAGTSKTSILRAITAGRMSAERTDRGGWSIQPAELFRVFEPKPVGPAGDGPLDRSADGPVGQTVPALDLLRQQYDQQIADLRDRLTEMKQDRDRWHEAATKALERPLMLPAPPAPAPRRWFWKRKAG
jgi:hypothetical protein